MIKILLLLFCILPLSSNLGFVIFLDDAPLKDATVILGNQKFTIENGYLDLAAVNQSWIEVLIEGQDFNLSLPTGSEFCLSRFYHCDLLIFDSSGNLLQDFGVSINGSDLGRRSRIIVPSGRSILKITTQYMEYCLGIDISAPTRLSITLPVSDLNILLTSHYGNPLKNQSLTLMDNNSIECALMTDSRGFVKLASLPHGIYTLSISGEEITFLHNSSIKQRFTIDPVKYLSVEVENSYLLFPTRVLVKLITSEDLPLPNFYVELEYDGTKLWGFTDQSGAISFYIPPSISTSSDIQVSTSGISKSIRIYRNPAPLILSFVFMGAILVKRLLKNAQIQI
ncbi:MAG: MSCRAMM family protein [Candidatus Methanomethylicaceae archaeon]